MHIASTYIPDSYVPKLTPIETEIGIKLIKDTFERELAKTLQLLRVSAPLMVPSASGINDNLSGVERPVSFDVPATESEYEIVQSLAKWKRLALKRYQFPVGQGLYTDMNAIRRDETVLDNIHSIYVDQWDWEQVISAEMRNNETLELTVKSIVHAMVLAQKQVHQQFPNLASFEVNENILFITSQELEDLYPDLDDKGREHEITKKYGTVFIKQIGGKLRSGKPHDLRAPDYDDWSLNGDLLLWFPILETAVEITSMGIRVNPERLVLQLEETNLLARKELPYHKELLSGELPLTIGGGVGQSRLCMLFLEKAHIGEVQASVWPNAVADLCMRKNIPLL